MGGRLVSMVWEGLAEEDGGEHLCQFPCEDENCYQRQHLSPCRCFHRPVVHGQEAELHEHDPDIVEDDGEVEGLYRRKIVVLERVCYTSAKW